MHTLGCETLCNKAGKLAMKKYNITLTQSKSNSFTSQLTFFQSQVSRKRRYSKC